MPAQPVTAAVDEKQQPLLPQPPQQPELPVAIGEPELSPLRQSSDEDDEDDNVRSDVPDIDIHFVDPRLDANGVSLEDEQQLDGLPHEHEEAHVMLPEGAQLADQEPEHQSSSWLPGTAVKQTLVHPLNMSLLRTSTRPPLSDDDLALAACRACRYAGEQGCRAGSCGHGQISFEDDTTICWCSDGMASRSGQGCPEDHDTCVDFEAALLTLHAETPPGVSVNVSLSADAFHDRAMQEAMLRQVFADEVGVDPSTDVTVEMHEHLSELRAVRTAAIDVAIRLPDRAEALDAKAVLRRRLESRAAATVVLADAGVVVRGRPAVALVDDRQAGRASASNGAAVGAEPSPAAGNWSLSNSTVT